MNAQEWEKLKLNWKDIIDIQPSTVVPDLFSKDVINQKEKEEIEHSGTITRQMEKLINILNKKPTDKLVFRKFLDSLRKENDWLAKKIDNTKPQSDASLISQPDPKHLEDDVRDVLHKHYINKTGCSTLLSDIRATLMTEGVFTHANNWNNETLKEFMCNEFLRVEVIKQKKREGKNAKRVLVLKNIGEKEISAITLESKKEACLLESSTALNVIQEDIQTMTPIQLKQYLQSIFEKDGLDMHPLDELEKKNVSGKVFLTMKEEDFKSEIPSASFGTWRTLSTMIKQYFQPQEQKPMPEYFRKFDSIVKQTDKYNLGRCMDVSHNIGAKTTEPVKNFHLVDEKDKDKAIEFIGSEVIPFISACLNDRRNGTIYFGISPEKSQTYECGEIVGVNLLQLEVQAEINDFIKKSFLDNQTDLINKTVRDAKFIPVLGATKENLHVIEVDVVPSSRVLDKDIIRTKLKTLPVFLKKHKCKEVVFRFSEDGLPEVVLSEKLYDYEKGVQSRLIEQRRYEETQKATDYTPNLRKKLLNLLTGGSEVIQDTIFTFMMSSPIDEYMNEEYIKENMSFIKHLHPEIVFDFDPNGSISGIYNNLDNIQEEEMRVLTTDDFDKQDKNNDDFNKLTESLANENRISWMFCNGYTINSVDEMIPTKWNVTRRNAFQNALKFYIENFDADRIIIIICLFSKNYEVMIEACDEVLTKLPDNWILLAENEHIAKLWQDQILARNRVEKKVLGHKCVIGMPWNQVNTTITHATKTSGNHECYLPCSAGGLVEIREKKLKDWSDISILSAGDFHIPDDGREKKKKEIEEKFYRGEQADWLNFYFHDQVLKRDIHNELMNNVRNALEGRGKDEDDRITIVPILHQPGAGGTTSAKQVLWDIRKEFRCCMVLTISDQTCEQLDEIRRYNDTYPKPLLILIDNEDDERFLQLRGSLEEKGRKRWKDSEEHFNVYCTIILCIRRASLPKQLKIGQVSLRQELTTAELEWFKQKNDSLTKRFETNKDTNVNPKFLISFNILRENFNKEYISKVVKEFSEDVKKDGEVNLLKIISLLNNYDPDFKMIPVSCLDKMMEQKRGQNRTKARSVKWEATLSQGVTVLLNLSSNKRQPYSMKKAIRVFNKVIAQEILTRMKERTEQTESEIMLELLESGVFEQESVDSNQLQSIISNVMKKREFKSDGIKKHKFSKFVMHVQKTESSEQAVKLLETLFKLNKDPFTAQLIARFYIDLKNWERAEQFAKRATSMLATNSFLWDTYGQVFKNQLYDKIASEKTLERAEGFKDGEIHELIVFAEKCIECFRKEQKISEREITTNGDNNFAGYFGELRAIVLLLSALKLSPAFSSGDLLHRYLVEQNFKPASLSFLSSSESDYLKSLEKCSKEAMRRLDEEYLQMKGNTNLAIDAPNFDFDRQSLIDLKVNLDVYFGEKNNTVPQNLSESDKYEYRYRRARNLGATSLNSLLQLKQNKEYEKLLQIYHLVRTNINKRIPNIDNIKALLDTVTILLLDLDPLKDLNYENILEWSKKLYSLGLEKSLERPYLETFLYYVLYNFPTKERQEKFNLCLPKDLSNALSHWHQAFQKKYPKYGMEEISLKRRETTLFFLGNGEPLKDIVYYENLQMMNDHSVEEKWQIPAVKKQLRLQTGILANGGEKVTLHITTPEGNTFPLSILTSHRVNRRNMWQKKVYFYVGFSFSGPRAFGMSVDEPGKDISSSPKSAEELWKVVATSQKPQYTSHPKAPSPRQPHMLVDLVTQRQQIDKDLKKQQDTGKKKELERKSEEISIAIKKIIGE